MKFPILGLLLIGHSLASTFENGHIPQFTLPELPILDHDGRTIGGYTQTVVKSDVVPVDYSGVVHEEYGPPHEEYGPPHEEYGPPVVPEVRVIEPTTTPHYCPTEDYQAAFVPNPPSIPKFDLPEVPEVVVPVVKYEVPVVHEEYGPPHAEYGPPHVEHPTTTEAPVFVPNPPPAPKFELPAVPEVVVPVVHSEYGPPHVEHTTTTEAPVFIPNPPEVPKFELPEVPKFIVPSVPVIHHEYGVPEVVTEKLYPYPAPTTTTTTTLPPPPPPTVKLLPYPAPTTTTTTTTTLPLAPKLFPYPAPTTTTTTTLPPPPPTPKLFPYPEPTTTTTTTTTPQPVVYKSAYPAKVHSKYEDVQHHTVGQARVVRYIKPKIVIHKKVVRFPLLEKKLLKMKNLLYSKKDWHH